MVPSNRSSTLPPAYNAESRRPVPLPIDIKKYTVNRAAFIDKDSREQFEMPSISA